MAGLITAADLAKGHPGNRVTVQRGTIVTPGAWDYAHEHGIEIAFGEAEDADGIARRVVHAIVDQLRKSLGREPSREEALCVVRAVMQKARDEAGA
ncbi:MAG: hypothetical protein NUW23_05260 [Firmicutes bacterium]|jgi:ethanolamine utilization cobalamin adenosyltransferase|nr:hypothetical protein [Bacillota bacterium]